MGGTCSKLLMNNSSSAAPAPPDDMRSVSGSQDEGLDTHSAETRLQFEGGMGPVVGHLASCQPCFEERLMFMASR